MFIEQIYTKCLAEAAYYIESNGEAAVIDPLRDVDAYLEMAQKRNAKIKYVFETHFHADFVSGHIDLAQQTGADIVFGPTDLDTGFNVLIARDGQEFKLGNCIIKLIHTPGHTMESSCYLLHDESGKQKALFTGDTLFIGDVGRPDLAQKVIKELTQEKLAGHLFDSLRNKILLLDDDIIVYPAHGAGSACGKNMSQETSDTLRNQKLVNYALNPKLSREDFIKEVLSGLTPPPAYFPQNVMRNLSGYESLASVKERGAQPLTVAEFNRVQSSANALIIDTRDAQLFAKGFIPGSYNIGIDGSFAVWVGTLIRQLKQAILIVAQPGREEEVVIRLARVGYDNALGFLEGGFESWKKAGGLIETIESIDAEQLKKLSDKGNIDIVDVRKRSEYESEHLVGAQNEPLDYIADSHFLPQAKKTYYVHCAGGYRSMTYISILRAKGFRNLVDVKGGFSALKTHSGFEISEYVCPTTML